MGIWQKIKDDPAWTLFLAFAFLAMVSMPLARAALVASFVAALARHDDRAHFRLNGPTAGWLLYLAIALVGGAIIAAHNTDDLITPARGLRKITKLAWFLAIPLASALTTSRERLVKVLTALSLGGIMLGGVILVLHPALAWLQVNFPTARQIAAGTATGLPAVLHAVAASLGLDAALDKALTSEVWAPWGGRPPSFYYAFTTLGTMRDAQRLMVALITSVCLLLPRHGEQFKFDLAKMTGTILIVAGLILTCKRGPLLVGVGLSFVILATRIRWWKSLLLLACVCLAAFSVPQVRARFADLPAEFRLKSGGRVLMWTKIVPALHDEHPYGIGFRALTAEKMRSIDRHVERNRTHVHSVPLQVFVDFGYLGLGIWATWMLMALHSAARLARESERHPESTALTAPFAMLAALILFGLVEYNLADAAVIPLYSLSLGFSAPFFMRLNEDTLREK